jgi:hypothetical protein
MMVRIGKAGYNGWVEISDEERFMNGLLMLDVFSPITYDFSYIPWSTSNHRAH